ncbi:uncharacterized protein [Rutidosis leptorrhynchoides]|uniref:uncharacterized protein n=1 Tax=Rutidosis leptorrhynchoides TaxID=125765 RepID=UPI003A993C6B
MLEMKKLDAKCHKYLSDIPPKHWARSHFTHRAVSDVLLNNMCEVLNRWLCDARDKPIVTALEYVREYMMKRIANVLTEASKCDGPLTPTATKIFAVVQKEANSCGVMWNGTGQYQVNGPHGFQVVVDMENRTCSCRIWEITGIPCKHVVAVLYDMSENSIDIGHVENWVHRVYKLETWKEAYAFSIKPVPGRELWTKSSVTTKLLPPKKIKSAGRPKKSRRKSMDEKEEVSVSGKLTRKGKTVKCGHCGQFGHNQRGCGNEGIGEKRKNPSEATTSARATNKKGKQAAV